VWDVVEIRCPYCFERVELLLDPQEEGELVQDCEVCCNPWKLRVLRDREGKAEVSVERLQ
jgi:hypothetical protein